MTQSNKNDENDDAISGPKFVNNIPGKKWQYYVNGSWNGIQKIEVNFKVLRISKITLELQTMH